MLNYFFPRSVPSDECKFHKNQKLTALCLTCDMGACETCIKADELHKDHELARLDTDLEKIKNHLEKKIQALSQKKTTLDRQVSEYDNYKQNMIGSRVSIRQQVNADIEEKCNQVLDYYNQALDERRSSLKDRLSELISDHEQIQEIIDKAAKFRAKQENTENGQSKQEKPTKQEKKSLKKYWKMLNKINQCDESIVILPDPEIGDFLERAFMFTWSDLGKYLRLKFAYMFK
jgi:hypothetical protein